jgi:hypothetical protein
MLSRSLSLSRGVSGINNSEPFEINRARDAAAFSDFLMPELYFANHLRLSWSLFQSDLFGLSDSVVIAPD